MTDQSPRILVTGGLGYIGSHTVVELSNAGYQSIIIDDLSNSSPDILSRLQGLCTIPPIFYEVSILDYMSMLTLIDKHLPIDGVIHFAAKKSVSESLEQPLNYFENNISGMINILKLIQAFDISTFIFSSSCTVYGEPKETPVTESTLTTRSKTPYGNSKLWAEQIIENHTSLTPSLKSILLRYFNPVGAHNSGLIGELPKGVPSNLMPFITQTAAGWRSELKVYGNDYSTPDGTAIRDYIHVVDLANAHVRALEFAQNHPKNQLFDVFNVGTGKGNSVLEVIKTFESVNNISLNYDFAPRRAGDVEAIWADTQKVFKTLNWKPQFTLEDMVRTSWLWQQQLSESAPI